MVTHLLDYSSTGHQSASPRQTVFLLHGILGSGRNFGTLAGRLAELCPGLRVIAPDLRGHGGSLGLPGPHGLATCVADLERLAVQLGGLPAVVIGHSFGGKLALLWGSLQAQIQEVFSLDSPPGPGLGPDDPVSAEVYRLLDVLEQLRVTPPVSRRQLVDQLLEQGFPRSIAAWTTTNFQSSPSGLALIPELSVVRSLLADYAQADLWPLIEPPRPDLKVTLVRAGKSEIRWRADLARLAHLAPGVSAPLFKEAGHWIHVDDLVGLIRLVLPRLKEACCTT